MTSDWIDNAREAISVLPNGAVLSAGELVRRARVVVGDPDDPRKWGIALAEAELSDALEFTGKCDRLVNFLPRNPVYKIISQVPDATDFWGELKARGGHK